MKFNLKAIICFLKDSHDISQCDEDTFYGMNKIPESGVNTKCKRCGEELTITLDKDDPDYYWITESDLLLTSGEKC